MNICWDKPQFPYKVMAAGGIYVFKDREVPDTFSLIGEYAAGHTLVLCVDGEFAAHSWSDPRS